jgi:SAM-dependent methyltransferase
LDNKKERFYQFVPPSLRKSFGFILKGWLTDIPAKEIPPSIRVPLPIENGKVLDIGCGAGHHLLWFKRYGWETYGVEISELACKRARERGLEVFNGDLLEANFPDDYFDLITIHDVLEHTFKPKEILGKIHRILKPGGIVMGTMPNCDSLERRIFKEYWFLWEVPRHLYHFSVFTLTRLLKETNFTKFKIETCNYYDVLGTLNKSVEKIRENKNNKLYYLYYLTLFLQHFLKEKIYFIANK